VKVDVQIQENRSRETSAGPDRIDPRGPPHRDSPRGHPQHEALSGIPRVRKMPRLWGEVDAGGVQKWLAQMWELLPLRGGGSECRVPRRDRGREQAVDGDPS